MFVREREEVALVNECDVAYRFDKKGAVEIIALSVSGQETPGYGKSEILRPAFEGFYRASVIRLGGCGHRLCIRDKGCGKQFRQNHYVSVRFYLIELMGCRDEVVFDIGIGDVKRYDADFKHYFGGFRWQI